MPFLLIELIKIKSPIEYKDATLNSGYETDFVKRTENLGHRSIGPRFVITELPIFRGISDPGDYV